MKINLKTIRYTITAAAVLSFFPSCEPEIDRDLSDYNQRRGKADFSTYVALGNSLTGGGMDNQLNRFGQENSYPAIMADKMAAITPGFKFNQPLLPEGIAEGTLQFQGLTANASPIIVPLTEGLNDEQLFAPISGRFHNLGVYGAKTGDLTQSGYGSDQGNPYFARMASSPNATIVEDALALNPTFFTLWIGNNDVLEYATEGGVEGGATITPVADFEESMNSIVEQLMAANDSIEGAIANIINITTAPYFTTIRYNQLELSSEQAQMANEAYRALIVESEGGLGEQVKVGVVTTVVITGAVATNAIFEQARQEATDDGYLEPEASQRASNYIASEEGQLAIAQLTNTLLQDEIPAEYASLESQIGFLVTNPDQRPEPVNTTINSLLEAEALPAELQTAVNAETENQINLLKSAGIYPVFNEGPNPFVIEDSNPANPLGIRQMREGELVLLKASTDGLLTPENALLPKPDAYILDGNELLQINEAIQAYNEIIEEITQTHTLALVDINSQMNQLSTSSGITEDGITFTSSFFTGNTFSLDGVHLTQRGYALIAKRFIQAINAYYNSSISLPNVSNYPAVGLPAN